MTEDDILRMAREAGLWEADISRPLFDFAALLRDRMLSEGWRQCAQGQRTTQFCGMVEQARQEEREACARVCEEYAQAKYAATAIRARKDT